MESNKTRKRKNDAVGQSYNSNKEAMKDDSCKNEEINDSGSEEEIEDEGSGNEETEDGDGSENVLADSKKRFSDTTAALDAPPPSKVLHLTKSDLYKPPTNEEMNQFKETENLFHSTLFRMQITEILKEVKLKAKQRQKMTAAVTTVTTLILSIKQGKKHELQDQKWLQKNGMHIPFVQHQEEIKGSFQFMPPSEVKVTGSFLSDTCMKPNICVDLLVLVPKEFFDPKDYQNHRYTRKRAMYLTCIASTLCKSADIENVKFTYFHNNPLKPVLLAAVKVDGSKAVQVTIQVVPGVGVFKLNRFHFAKNNVRKRWFQNLSETENQDNEETPTPFYNSSILMDLVSNVVEDIHQKLLLKSQGVKEGIILLKIWLHQRELDVGFGCFNGHIMSMFVLYLLSKKKLNNFMSSYQVVRNTLRILSQSDWTTEGITMCTDKTDSNMPDLMDFHKHFDVVFVDDTGYFNICFALNKTMFYMVKHESSMAVTMLEDKMSDHFDSLFMKKIAFTSKFDHLFHIQPLEAFDQAVEKLSLADQLLDFYGDRVMACRSKLVSILTQALGQRVTLLQVQPNDGALWSVNEKPPRASSQKLTVGLLLNSEFGFNILDRGPSADAVEAEEFRQFWGDVAELRRFQDGGICEAVLWMDKCTINQKQLVVEKIVKHVLKRHAGIQPLNVRYMGSQLDELLHLPAVLPAKDGQLPYGTGEEQNLEIIRVYDDLCKQLYKLTGLPLVLNTIQGVSPCFRFTEVFPPMPCTFRHNESRSLDYGVKRYVPCLDKPCPLYTHVLNVVCSLEGSGKWPDDLEAMRRVKAAFYIQLGKAIYSNFNLPVKTGVTYVDVLKLVEGDHMSEAIAILTSCQLLILIMAGIVNDNYVFRLVLSVTREIALLKTVKMPDGKLLKRDTEEALLLERDTITLPRLTSILHGLHQQQPSFSSTVRLAKRWINAHLLGYYIGPVAVELIVAYLYISPHPHVPPRSALSGFQRFLEFLSTFDWNTMPLMVNLNNEFTETDISEIKQKFSKERSTLPLMFISTPLDKYSMHWTKHTPSAVILYRLVLFATKSLVVIQDQMQGIGEPNLLKSVFRTALDVYDVLIHLKLTQLPRQHEAVDVIADTCPLAYGKAIDHERFPALDFDPVQCYLKDLRSAFGDLCLFFHDTHGGSVIGVMWKPDALKPREFKVSHINYSKLVPSNSANGGKMFLAPNLDAVLEDIEILGRGLVDSIDVKANRPGNKQ